MLSEIESPLNGRNPPRVYFASKLYRAPQWREIKAAMEGMLEVVSTWHDDHEVVSNESNDLLARDGWKANHYDVKQATTLLAHGVASDPLNGTLIEIGMALARLIPIILVGNYPWGTWRLLPNITQAETLHEGMNLLMKGPRN